MFSPKNFRRFAGGVLPMNNNYYSCTYHPEVGAINKLLFILLINDFLKLHCHIRDSPSYNDHRITEKESKISPAFTIALFLHVSPFSVK